MWETIPAFYKAEPFVFVAFWLNLYTLGGNLQLLWEQWKAISNNLTHNEILTGLKYSYFRNRTGEVGVIDRCVPNKPQAPLTW